MAARGLAKAKERVRFSLDAPMRCWPSGRAPPFQGGYAGSIPVQRSIALEALLVMRRFRMPDNGVRISTRALRDGEVEIGHMSDCNP